jgi:trehalose synthase
MYEINISPRSIEPFVALAGFEPIQTLTIEAESIRAALGPRSVWNINSTAAGGGVAEMLRSQIRYARGLEIDVRWLVLEGPQAFFRITKRLHNALHGSTGDGLPLGPEQAALYEQVMKENAVALDPLVRAGDVVICHDPQTAGLIAHLMSKGAYVVWRCHVGQEDQNGEVELGWEFLRPYIERVPFAIFSRSAYAPSWLDPRRAVVLAPSIDPFSAKNQAMDEPAIRAILCRVGLLDDGPGLENTSFHRDDGSLGRVDREAEVLQLGRPPQWETPLVVQVSRWDAMKDPRGVLDGFLHLDAAASHGAHLVLAGPSVDGIADDPEAPEVFGELEHTWRGLPHALRRTVHLALLPMADVEENAAIVNALQRHASVIVQKSLREGFGLTVTEAMWKRRPVLASAVGGILDQIRDGVDGLLIHDPSSPTEFAQLLGRLLSDPPLGQRLGDSAWARVRDNYTTLTTLRNWARLMRELLQSEMGTHAAP